MTQRRADVIRWPRREIIQCWSSKADTRKASFRKYVKVGSALIESNPNARNPPLIGVRNHDGESIAVGQSCHSVLTLAGLIYER